MKDQSLWTAIITPLFEDGTFDKESFIKLLKIQDNAGIGIVVLGSTGEALNLNEEEKKLVIKTAMEQKLNTPIIAGVGGFLLEECKDWIKWCESMGIQGFLVPTPLYSKPSIMGQYYWFKELLDTAKTPCMLYNVPSRAGTTLKREALEKLLDHPNFWSFKEASGSVEEFKAYRSLLKSQKLLSGDDILMPEFGAEGADGLVSVAANIWPNETNSYMDSCLNKSISSQDKEKWHKIASALFLAPNPVPTKWILKKQGLIKSDKLKAPLTTEDLTDIETVNETINLL